MRLVIITIIVTISVRSGKRNKTNFFALALVARIHSFVSSLPNQIRYILVNTQAARRAYVCMHNNDRSHFLVGLNNEKKRKFRCSPLPSSYLFFPCPSRLRFIILWHFSFNGKNLNKNESRALLWRLCSLCLVQLLFGSENRDRQALAWRISERNKR